MRQLPRTGRGQNNHLEQRPLHNTGIGRLGLIAEFSLTFLSPN